MKGTASVFLQRRIAQTMSEVCCLDYIDQNGKECMEMYLNTWLVKVKVKVTFLTGHEGPEGNRGIALLFL